MEIVVTSFVAKIIVVLIAAIIIAALAYNKQDVWSVLVIAAVLGVLQWLCKADVIGFGHDYWRHLLIGAFIYGGCGVVWLVIKWIRYANTYSERAFELYSKNYQAFLVRHKLSEDTQEIPEELRSSWQAVLEAIKHDGYHRYLRDDYGHCYDRSPVTKSAQVSEHKMLLIRWGMYWPISLGSWVFVDMVRDGFTFIYHRLEGVLQRLSDDIHRKYFEKAKV